MNSSTEHIKTILLAETSLVFADDLHVGREPSSPNNTVTLFDAPDRGPLVGYDNGVKYYYTAVQIRVRNSRYDDAMKQAWDLVDVLHNRGNETVGDTFVTKIEALDNPFLLDWDENNRARVVINFAVQQTPQPQT